MSLFPHSDPIELGHFRLSAKRICDLIGPLMTSERRQRMCEVVAGRTYHVTTVMENIYDRGNLSAVMRSSEALGFQSVHIIESGTRFKSANRVSKGADKWLDVRRWSQTRDCVEHLKTSGYQILATHLDARSRPIHEVDFSRPTALVLGNEKDGVSPELLQMADASVILPMAGFVQSFNISVAGALCLYHAQRELHRLELPQIWLDDEQRQILLAHYYLRSSDRPERLLERLTSS